MTSDISVIIPAYQAEKWLSRAVESCLAQTLPPAEIIIVDDASRDATFSVAQQLAGKHAQVRAFKHEHNRGPAAARNLGARNSRGVFLAFLDADDYWHAEKLQRQYQTIAAQPALGLVISALREVRPDGSKIRDVRFRLPAQREARVAASFLFQIKLITPTMFMPRKVYEEVGGLDESLRTCEDHDLFMRIAAAHEVACLNELLVYRCVTPRSASQTGTPHHIESNYRRFLSLSLQRFPYLRKHASAFEAKLDFQVGRRFQRQGDTYNARRYFARSFQTKPTLKRGLAWATANLPRSWQGLFAEKPWRRVS